MPATSSTAPKTVFLHVGCRKSGTSALQLGLRTAADELRAEGLEQPLGARGGIMTGLLDPLAGDDVAARESAVERLASIVRESEHPRHLVTLEAMAELGEEATSLVVRALAEFDTHVVVTARPWAYTIPSEWQQLVKSRFVHDYPSFAQAVHDPASASEELAVEAARFRRRQDVADVVRRWRAADPELPVHVIWVPQSRHAVPGLTELFCHVVGVDPETLPVPDRLVNPSISHEHAEVLRLVNIALGDRLRNSRGNYRYSVRKWIAVGTMMKGSPGSRIRLPRHLEAWASEEARRQVEAVRAAGCDVHGDEDAFVHPELSGDDFVPATDAEVARAAAGVIADLAAGHDRDRRRESRKGKGRGTASPPSPPSRPVSDPGDASDLLSRVRRRVGRLVTSSTS